MIEQYPIPQPQQGEANKRFQSPADICQHEYELRRMDCINGASQYRQQCVKCGKATGAISLSTISLQQKRDASAFDKDMANRVHQAAWEHWRLSAEYDREVKWQAWYATYLESDVWHRRRAAVIARAGGICEACRKAKAVMAHHTTYVHVGAEPLYDLVAVCKSCHDQVHGQVTP